MIHNKKVVIIGDGGWGKTNLTRRLRGLTFDSKYIATVGCQVHTIPGLAGNSISLWDTAGQVKFGGHRNGYFTDSDAAIIVYSLTSANSASRVNGWIEYYHQTCPGKPVLVVATGDDELHQVEAQPGHLVISNKYGTGIGVVREQIQTLFSDNSMILDG